ncbi:MAG: hypothetical protein LBC97_06505, partial [Bifidobacteriaceae bacterium]|nr:hypothetical protein [Bifidobacteriaceae bacterium]
YAKLKALLGGLAVLGCGAVWMSAIGLMETYQTLGLGGTFQEALSILSDPDPLGVMSEAAQGGTGLRAPEAALHVIMLGLAELILALGLCSWLPLGTDALFGRLMQGQSDHPRAESSVPRKVVAAVFVVAAFAAALLSLVVAWQVLPLISRFGGNPDLVWQGTDERVLGVGPYLGGLGVIAAVALLLLPTYFGLRGVLYREARGGEGTRTGGARCVATGWPTFWQTKRG